MYFKSLPVNGAFGQSTVTLRNGLSRTQSSCDEPLFLGRGAKPSWLSIRLNSLQSRGGNCPLTQIADAVFQ